MSDITSTISSDTKPTLYSYTINYRLQGTPANEWGRCTTPPSGLPSFEAMNGSGMAYVASSTTVVLNYAYLGDLVKGLSTTSYFYSESQPTSAGPGGLTVNHTYAYGAGGELWELSGNTWSSVKETSNIPTLENMNDNRASLAWAPPPPPKQDPLKQDPPKQVPDNVVSGAEDAALMVTCFILNQQQFQTNAEGVTYYTFTPITAPPRAIMP